MRQPLHILLHHGDPHGDMEPVQDMLGGRGHVLGQVDNRIAAICHERHRLVFLPALLFQDLMKSPFWLGVVTLDKAKVAGWAICWDGLSDRHLKMGLSGNAGSDVSTVDSDGDWAFWIG